MKGPNLTAQINEAARKAVNFRLRQEEARKQLEHAFYSKYDDQRVYGEDFRTRARRVALWFILFFAAVVLSCLAYIKMTS